MKIQRSKLLLTGMAGVALFLAIPLTANKANAEEVDAVKPTFLQSLDTDNAVYSAEVTTIERRMKLGFDVDEAGNRSDRGLEHDGQIKGRILELGAHIPADRGTLSLTGYLSTGIDGEYKESTYSNAQAQSEGYERIAYQVEGDSEASIWGLSAELQYRSSSRIKPIIGAFYEGMNFETDDEYQGWQGLEYEQTHFKKEGFEGGYNSAFDKQTDTTMHRLGVYAGASVPVNFGKKISAEAVIKASPVNFAFGGEDGSGADLTYGLGYQLDVGASIAYRPINNLTVLAGYNFGMSSSYSDSRDYIKDAEMTLGVGYKF